MGIIFGNSVVKCEYVSEKIVSDESDEYVSEKIIKMENSLLAIFGKIWPKSLYYSTGTLA